MISTHISFFDYMTNVKMKNNGMSHTFNTYYKNKTIIKK